MQKKFENSKIRDKKKNPCEETQFANSIIRDNKIRDHPCEETQLTIMKMALKAVCPYIHPNSINFKYAPFEAWVRLGGETARSLFPPRLLHALAYKYELPDI